jgi:surfeit locus 1 family protein
MLAILLALGTWQIHRLHWKEALLARIAAAEKQPAEPLGPNPEPFAKASVTGRLHPELAALYGTDVRDTPAGPQLGAQLLVPMERPGSAPILIDLGWVPEGGQSAIQWPDGPQTVTGYVRLPDAPGWFTPRDDPATRHFYTLNPSSIGAMLGLKNLAPVTLVGFGPAIAGHFPTPAQHLPRPVNNHLQYALTWYGLAGALLVVFVPWFRKELRE